MSDTFDALREAHVARGGWIRAARALEQVLLDVPDANSRKHLRRRFDQAIERPLAPADEGWRIVADAVSEAALEAPLSWLEAEEAGIDAVTAEKELRKWQAGVTAAVEEARELGRRAT